MPDDFYVALRAADAELGIEDPEQAAVALNAQTVNLLPAPVPILTVTHYLRRLIRPDNKSAWLHIKAAADTNPAAGAAVDYNEDPRAQTIDLADPVVSGLVHGLVQTGLITETEAGELFALTVQTVPRWIKPGSVDPLGRDDILAVRQR